jgi:choline monooxygenase
MGPNKTMNMVEFYYPEEIVAFEREFVEAQQAAYNETCIEDDEIGERMDAGRAALLARGDNEVGPYQSPMEDGMPHFHEWYRRQMGAWVAERSAQVKEEPAQRAGDTEQNALPPRIPGR